MGGLGNGTGMLKTNLRGEEAIETKELRKMREPFNSPIHSRGEGESGAGRQKIFNFLKIRSSFK